MLTWLRFLVLLVSSVGLGFRLMVGASPVLMLLSGRAVLCEFSSLLGSLLWLADTGDLGHFGVSNLEVLVLFEQWAGQQRLPSEKVTRPHVRAHRPISIPSMFVSEGIEIRQECRSIIAVLLANFSVELVGFYLVLLVGICPGCGTWRGSGVRMV